jgi:dTDP-4-amino-4,6-dideoxygalactose transaminase
METQVTPIKVPLADIHLEREEVEAVTAVLQSGWLSMGPKIEEFEHRFAEFLGIKHAFAVANGTAALHLACEALGLKEGDEVLCPALTFVATANAILYTGARPIFVDVNGPQDLNLSAADAARKVTPRTRAIMVVHYAGYPCDMEAITQLARKHGLRVIEDCAHAPGAIHPSPQGPQKVGTLGDVGCFSFFANKNLTTGEGGMVVTADQGLAERIKTRRSHGMTTLTWDRHTGHSFSYDVITPGYNYRLDEIRAALGLVQLSRLAAGNAQRRRLTGLYRQKLMDLPQIQLPFQGVSLQNSACHLFPILLPAGADRAKFMEYLANRAIQTSIHYPPIPGFSYYRRLWPAGYEHGLPYTEDTARREVTLPLFPTLTGEQLDLVVESIKNFFQLESR